MNKTERIKATLSGENVDRVPASFWHHFPDMDFGGPLLAERLIAFNEAYDLDFIKGMPLGLYIVVDQGCKIKRINNPYDDPIIVDFAVTSPDDWEELPALDVSAGAWGEERQTLEILNDRVGEKVPYVAPGCVLSTNISQERHSL